MKHTLFEATIDEENNFHIEVDIPAGVEINITQADFMMLMVALSEVQFFCSRLQVGCLRDVLQAREMKDKNETQTNTGGTH